MSKRVYILGAAFFLSYTLLWVVVLFNVRFDMEEMMKKMFEREKKITYVVPTTLTGNTQVASNTIAAKLDLQRKIIKPSSSLKTAEVIRIIKSQGGNVIESKSGILVAHIPKERESAINSALTTSGSTNAIEIDYPTFLTADNPDWGVAKIKAPDVWQKTTASGIKIAVIDTGIDYTHHDLQGRYAGGIDTVNDDADPFDGNGHGTHVSGIVSSALDGSGIAGVAPGGQILAVKALGDDGMGYTSDLIEGIDYAIKNGAKVINFSIGTTSNVSALEDKIIEAASKGIILVAAAGNTNGGRLMYPAAYGSVISVAATDASDNLASFSSIGAEIAAPGVLITSTVPGNGYAAWSGTSMAAPHVAATAALMLATGQANIRQALHNTAIDLGNPGYDSYFGYGLVHAKPAVLNEDKLSPLVAFLSPNNGSSVQGLTEIKLNVQDESVIKAVALYANGLKLHEWTEAPTSYVWDTTGKEGAHELHVLAKDIHENLGEAKITVTVSKAILEPTPTNLPAQTSTPTQLYSPTLKLTPTRTTTPIYYVTPVPTQYKINLPGNSDENRNDDNYDKTVQKKEEKEMKKEEKEMKKQEEEQKKREEELKKQVEEQKKEEEELKKLEKEQFPDNLKDLVKYEESKQENNKDINIPAKQTPYVSNINERNQKPEVKDKNDKNAEKNKGAEKAKSKDVKGASTISVWDLIKFQFEELFGIN